MSFLAKLWDETLAGPAPSESEIGKLRRSESGPAAAVVPVSRSITVMRTNSGPGRLSVDPDLSAALDSPTTPGTPVTPSGDFKKFSTRRKLVPGSEGRAEPRNPTVYDWIVISALDR